MEAKLFYRVGTLDNRGMWYDNKGVYHGAMNSPEFEKLSCHKVQMPYDESIVGYLSVAETLEELKHWFNDNDMALLAPLGFRILTFEATDYRRHDNHWVINQETSILKDKQA